jgi:dienelactone hydrolase
MLPIGIGIGTFDPFARGPETVGVRTTTIRGAAFGASATPAEIWYPAARAHAGRDLDDATCDRFDVAPAQATRSQHAVRDAAPARGAFPLVVYCHDGGGHRRECTSICTHVASHGYVVVAADAAGDRRADPGAGREGGAPIDESARIRARQASAVIDAALSGVLAAPLRIDSTRIATVGLSLGGYAALAAHSLDARPSAAFALCPMAGPSPFVPQTAGLASLLRVDAGGRPVAVRALSGMMGPAVRAETVRDLQARLAPPSIVVLLEGSGHMDGADEADTAVARGLCVAHLDAHLNGLAVASAWLGSDLARIAAERGAGLELPGRAFARAGHAR